MGTPRLQRCSRDTVPSCVLPGTRPSCELTPSDLKRPQRHILPPSGPGLQVSAMSSPSWRVYPPGCSRLPPPSGGSGITRPSAKQKTQPLSEPKYSTGSQLIWGLIQRAQAAAACGDTGALSLQAPDLKGGHAALGDPLPHFLPFHSLHRRAPACERACACLCACVHICTHL